MTPRQVKLLHAIIDDFINNATAVGSLSLTHRYNLGVSPATIRNEMSDLVEQGYLEKPHSSSGRIPTNMAYRYFIREILDELDDLEHTLTANIYEELFQHRFDFDDLIYQALDHLSTQTKNTAIVLLENRIYYSGLSYLVDNPEFSDSRSLSLLLTILENKPLLNKIFNRAKSKNSVKIMIGEDSGIDGLDDIAFVFSDINLHGNKRGYLAVLGPTRLNYPKVIPIVDFFSHSLNQVISGW
jgi:transcriptional regulator of heat shock response